MREALQVLCLTVIILLFLDVSDGTPDAGIWLCQQIHSEDEGRCEND
jgi:hypothetical protein